MSSTFLSKKFLIKFIAVVTSVMLVLCLAPISNVFSAMSNVKAETETPVYDPSLGSYTASNGVLTATPNENAGFRGWFKKDGTEVSYNTTYTLLEGESASDFIPVFYDFNLVKNGGFEEYANGTNLSTGNVAEEEKWNGVTWEYISGAETGNWANSVKVTNAASRNGENSIVLNSPHHCTYKQINNLEPNTQYTLTYYYNIVPTTAEKDYLSRSYIVSGDISEKELMNGYSPNAANPYLDNVTFDATTGSCTTGQWKQVKHTFYTGENISVKLLIYYKNEAVNNVRPPMYIDDVSLVKDTMASPNEYFKEDFATGSVSNLSSLDSYSTLSASDGKLKVTVSSKSRGVQYAPFFAKKRR